MSDFIIELNGLTKSYGSHTVVNNLSLTIRKGEIFGLLGPNGAGKSTTILMMMGLAESDSGSVTVCGINPAVNPISVKRKVGYLPEDIGFYEDYTGPENLVYTARLNGFSVNEAKLRAEQLMRRVGLGNEMDKKTGKYSRGMRQRLGLADVLIKNPEVIILDEPTLGIDPAGVREFLDLIVKLSREEGITVLFSSHHLHQVQQVCDRVGLFVSGKLIAEGNIQALSQKLFSNSAYTIEAGISVADSEAGKAQDRIERLTGTLMKLDKVISVRQEGSILSIECSHDIAPAIAKTIVGTGVDLTYLNKKEYGLDDIYYRYFEGGSDHE